MTKKTKDKKESYQTLSVHHHYYTYRRLEGTHLPIDRGQKQRDGFECTVYRVKRKIPILSCQKVAKIDNKHIKEIHVQDRPLTLYIVHFKTPDTKGNHWSAANTVSTTALTDHHIQFTFQQSDLKCEWCTYKLRMK